MNSVFIPYGRQNISAQDIQAVVDVLKSNWITQGPIIELFEKRVSQYCSAKYAVAVNSATSALHIACLAAGLGEGDFLWTSPNTFVATANCGRYCGANIDFVDIDKRSFNISVDQLGQKLKSARNEKKVPKVVIPVHFAGLSCDMEFISDLAQQYKFTVIEDASHAIGGSYQGKKIGSCVFSDMVVFSFHPVKIITTGEGGMILTNRRDLYEKLIRLRSHGITRDHTWMKGEPHGPWYYQQIELGFNYRMTDIQAALGISQMSRLDLFVKRRHELAAFYNEAFKDLPVTTQSLKADGLSAYHLYVIRLKLEKLKKSRREIFEELRKRGIGVNIHYIPVHTQPYYRTLGFTEGMFPEAEHYYSETISLPLYFELKQDDQERVISAIREVLL